MMSSLFFSSFEVTRQAFYRTTNAFAIVNLKPIVPGHVLVVPTRRVQRLHDLTPAEIATLFSCVQRVGGVIERAYKANALTIACQDGKAAGQTVPHVHIHILPRKDIGDLFDGRNDEIYPALEEAEADLPQDLRDVASEATSSVSSSSPKPAHVRMDVPDDRPPRTLEEMIKEAEWLKTWFDSEDSPSP